jgi:hypothetical protein
VDEFNVLKPNWTGFHETEVSEYHHVTVAGPKPEKHYFYQLTVRPAKIRYLPGYPLESPITAGCLCRLVVGDTQATRKSGAE